jgi:hypothetical protein
MGLLYRSHPKAPTLVYYAASCLCCSDPNGLDFDVQCRGLKVQLSPVIDTPTDNCRHHHTNYEYVTGSQRHV